MATREQLRDEQAVRRLIKRAVARRNVPLYELLMAELGEMLEEAEDENGDLPASA